MSCPDCFRGGAATGTPSGTTQDLHGHATYIAKPPSPTSTSTIILYTDAFGHLLPNNKLLSDALSQATGLTVLCPDIIPGGGMSPSVLPLLDTFSSPTASYFSKGLAVARAMVYVIPFFARAGPDKPASTMPCIRFAEAVRKELGDGGKVGCVGYCWGGYQGLNIAGLEERVVDAVFFAHPAKFDPRQVVAAVEKGVKVSFAHAAEDMSLPMAKVDETKRVMEGKEGFELKVYEGCAHGFAVRATPGKEKEAKAADEALQQAVEWFKKWL
jgi:dienelactone hydrolase